MLFALGSREGPCVLPRFFAAGAEPLPYKAGMRGSPIVFLFRQEQSPCPTRRGRAAPLPCFYFGRSKASALQGEDARFPFRVFIRQEQSPCPTWENNRCVKKMKYLLSRRILFAGGIHECPRISGNSCVAPTWAKARDRKKIVYDFKPKLSIFSLSIFHLKS